MIIGVGEDGQIGFNEPGSYCQIAHAAGSADPQHAQNPVRARSSAWKTRRRWPSRWVSTRSCAPRQHHPDGVGRGESQDRPEGRRRRESPDQVPASNLQMHPNIEVVIDENAAQMLTREQTPWLVGPCKWTPKFTRKAVVWLCGVVTEADPETHLQGLYRKLAGRAARTGTRLRPDQHRRVQRPAAHHHGLAGRQAQRRRLDTPRIVGTVPQARGGILAPPRRRRHLDGRYLYPPRAAGTRRTRSLRNFGQRGRTRRRRAAEHRHGPRTGLRQTTTPRSRRSSPARRRANPNRVRCSTSRVPSAAPRHAPPSARSA